MNFFIYIGKLYIMMGNDVFVQFLGIMFCVIVWLFCFIDEQKEKMGVRFFVRVLVVEVLGKNEQLKDLLVDVVKCKGIFLIICFCYFFFVNKKMLLGEL